MSLSALLWTACRLSSLPSGPAALSLPSWTPPPGAQCVNALVPGTVLASLLRNGTFPRPDDPSTPMHDPYVDDWLSNSSIPDISQVGAPFYTFVYRAVLDPSTLPGCANPGARALALLSSAQLSYRAALFADGSAVPTVDGGNDAVGMFSRHDWSLGSARAWCAGATRAVAILFSPPDHPGLPSALCALRPPSFNESIPCGQGGDHSLAQDLISQDLGGWDWVQGSPDRNTGPVDGLDATVAPAGVLLRDGASSVTSLTLAGAGSYGARLARGNVVLRAALRNVGGTTIAGTITFALDVSDGAGGGSLVASVRVTLPPRSDWVEAATAPFALPAGVALWWSRGLGAQHLRAANATFVADGAHPDEPPTALTWRAGLRTVACDVDAALGGRACAVNGLRVFVEGGNFIATDLLSRPEFRDAARCLAEVALHAAMGFNAMRLWGGHAGHPDALFDSADEQGVLVWSEFWMSGDNNGRWAGNASWPLDHALYTRAVADTARRLRRHASLLVHVGGNELFPFDASPPPDLLAAMRATLARLDASTPFVQSSMGSEEHANFTGFDPEKAFAPADGPYGVVDERSFFNDVPGKVNFSVPFAFQPEIGASAHPPLASAARFLSAAALAQLPGPRGANVSDLWAWHAYESFGNDVGGDAVYALAPAGNASVPSEWDAAGYAAAAGVAQEAQVRALFEAYAERMGNDRSGVFYWKSASPWPALRGSLYDWYLAAGGGFFGARHALSEPIHVQLSRRPADAGGASVAVVNRGPTAIAGSLTARVTAFDVVTGDAAGDAQTFPGLGNLSPQTAARVPNSHFVWPARAAPGTALLWRVDLVDAKSTLISRSEYALSTLSNDAHAAAQNFSALAAARAQPAALRVTATCAAGARGGATARVSVSVADARRAALGIQCELADAARAVAAETGASDDRVLPLFPSDGFFALLPGEARELVLDAPAWPGAFPATTLDVMCKGWSASEVRVRCA